MHEGKRWGAADWADQQKYITLIGCGGIGSWTALSLARIGHKLTLFDGDSVDVTNVEGGQMFKRSQVGQNKAIAMVDICREFGTTSSMDPIDEDFDPEEFAVENITICAVDNMAARKAAFSTWRKNNLGEAGYPSIFIDGRLLLENMEIFAIKGDDKKAMKRYEKDHLFSDEEVAALDCTSKQTTFSAMIIAGMITATLCNFLTNEKLEMEMREVPFYQRMFLPIFDYRNQVPEPVLEEAVV